MSIANVSSHNAANTASPGVAGQSAVQDSRQLSLAQRQLLVDVPTRWVLLALGLWVLYRTQDAWVQGPWVFVYALYALIAVAATVFWLLRARETRGADARSSPAEAAVTYVLYMVDALFVAALIWRDGGLGSPLYILFVLLAVKALSVVLLLPNMVWLPFAFGPLYAAALWLASGSAGFLVDPGFVGRYVALLVWLIGIVLVALELARRSRQTVRLEGALAQQQATLALQTEVLQRTATDLGDRFLELRALQEVAKALATTLRTEETLQLVVERLASATGSSHCAVALIESSHADAPGLVAAGAGHQGGMLMGELLSDDMAAPMPFRLASAEEPSTLAACDDSNFPNVSSRPVRVLPDAAGSLGERLGGYPYYVTPLVSRGRAIGALYIAENASTAGRPDAAPTLNTSEQLLTSFAYFAATALENARLYQDAYEKRRELEAVLAGIGDGVVVAGTDLALILMNPVARDILGLPTEAEESLTPEGAPLKPYLSAPAFADLLAETLATGEEQIRELDLAAPGASFGRRQTSVG